MTAHVAIGYEDLYHAGLGPTHTMWLWENGRPCWLLSPMADGDPKGPEPWTARLIPSGPEQILADGLLFATLRAGDAGDLAELAESLDLVDLLESDFIDLTKHQPVFVEALRAKLACVGIGRKLVISVFGGSSLESQLPVLADYPVDVEVCTVTYSRLSGGWRTGTEERGSLRASWGEHGPTPDRYREVSFPTDLPAALAEDEKDDRDDRP